MNAEVRSAYPAAAEGLDGGEAGGDAALRGSVEAEGPVDWSPDGADGLDADAPGADAEDADAPGTDGVGADDGAPAP